VDIRIDSGGVGVLLLGPSGVGKSECALELIQRGHRLVADDVVEIRVEEAAAEGAGAPCLLGRAPELIRHFVEIRGIGILYVPDLFGPDSVREEARIDLVCRLEPWNEQAEYERVGLERPSEVWAGVPVPALVLPARPAGSMATVIEVAARDHLQRGRGESAAARLDARLRETGRAR
jgi:HPr kinase/phosphorylase